MHCPSRGFGFIILVGWLTLCGCASLTTADIAPVEPESAVLDGSQNRWWSVRILWQWPTDSPPAWHLDLLAAHQIVLPLINTYEEDLTLWRIHRRAARDEAGHRFSLIFFSSAQTARAIYADVYADPLLGDLVAAGMVRQVQNESATSGRQLEIADTSDPNWSPAVQACWPLYIHGVSRMWLNLVSLTANSMLADADPGTIAETAELYRQVDAEITAVWQKEGQHAFLHHLNAIFEYQPIPVVEKRWMNF